MKLRITPAQANHIKSLDSDKKRKEFFLSVIIENISEETPQPKTLTREKLNEITNPEKLSDTPKEFCVEITEENRHFLSVIWNEFHKRGNSEILRKHNYLHSNSDYTCCYSSNNRRRSDVYDSNDPNYNLPLVPIEEFLRLIGKEDLPMPNFKG